MCSSLDIIFVFKIILQSPGNCHYMTRMVMLFGCCFKRSSRRRRRHRHKVLELSARLCAKVFLHCLLLQRALLGNDLTQRCIFLAQFLQTVTAFCTHALVCDH